MQKRTDGWALVLYGLIVAMALGVLGSIVFFVAGIYHDSYDINTKMYQQNWHVTIPGNLKKEYYASSLGWFGEGETYAVYSWKDGYTQEDASFLEGMSSLKDTGMQEDIGDILKGLKADEQKYPDFSDDYRWKILGGDEGSRLYILYDTESSLLYLVQTLF